MPLCVGVGDCVCGEGMLPVVWNEGKRRWLIG